MGVAPHYAGVGTTQKCGRGSGGVCLVPHATLMKRECRDLQSRSYSIEAVILSYSH